VSALSFYLEVSPLLVSSTDLVLARVELLGDVFDAVLSARPPKLFLAPPLLFRVRREGLLVAVADDDAGSGCTCLPDDAEAPETAGWAAAGPVPAATLFLARLVCRTLKGVLFSPTAVCCCCCCSARMTELSSWLAMYGHRGSSCHGLRHSRISLHRDLT
jgi:hypothetical protein